MLGLLSAAPNSAEKLKFPNNSKEFPTGKGINIQHSKLPLLSSACMTSHDTIFWQKRDCGAILFNFLFVLVCLFVCVHLWAVELIVWTGDCGAILLVSPVRAILHSTVLGQQ